MSIDNLDSSEKTITSFFGSESEGDNPDIEEFDDDELIDARNKKKVAKNYSFVGLSGSADQGKMMDDENEEVINVEWSTYKAYVKMFGGWKVFIGINIIMMGYMATSIISNYLLGQWSDTING